MDEVLATIRRIIAEDEQGGRPAAAGGASGGGSADEVLELTEALNEDGTVRRLAPIGAASPAADGIREPPPPAPDKPEPEARPEPQLPREEPPPSPSPQQSAPGVEQPVSQATSATAAVALARLVSQARAEGEAAQIGDRPLEEIVRDELRPMLRSWLDEHLPQTVERLVQAELSRIFVRPGPS